MDRRDRGLLGLARPLGLAELEEPAAHAFAKLGGRLVGERDGQDRGDVDAVEQYAAHEPLDQDECLSAAGSSRDQQRAGALVDGRALLGRQRDPARSKRLVDHAPTLRQMPG